MTRFQQNLIVLDRNDIDVEPDLLEEAALVRPSSGCRRRSSARSVRAATVLSTAPRPDRRRTTRQNERGKSRDETRAFFDHEAVLHRVPIGSEHSGNATVHVFPTAPRLGIALPRRCSGIGTTPAHAGQPDRWLYCPAQGRSLLMNQKFSLNVNGKDHTVEADPDTPLLYVLRDDLGLNNPHFGCGLGQCGACTVHLDGKPIHSCRRPISPGRRSRRSSRSPASARPSIRIRCRPRMCEEQVPQCAYCINGWIMTAAAFLRDNKKPTDEEIRTALHRHQMPLRHPHGHPARRQARRRDDGLREAAMTRHEKSASISPAALCSRPAARLSSRSAHRSRSMPSHAADDATAVATKPPLTPDQLSSYIAVNADGTVSAYFGKMDMGQGLSVAIRQMVAEELDVPFESVEDFHRRHRDQRQSGRRLRLDRRPGGRQADAHGRRRSAARAGRDGGR